MSKSDNKLPFKVLGRKVVVANPMTNFNTNLIIGEKERRAMAEEQIKNLAKTEVLQVGEAIEHIKLGDMICIKQLSRGRYEIIEIPKVKEEASIIETEDSKESSGPELYFVFDEMDVLAIYE